MEFTWCILFWPQVSSLNSKVKLQNLTHSSNLVIFFHLNRWNTTVTSPIKWGKYVAVVSHDFLAISKADPLSAIFLFICLINLNKTIFLVLLAKFIKICLITIALSPQKFHCFQYNFFYVPRIVGLTCLTF